jgi:exonuclease VII small subunit
MDELTPLIAKLEGEVAALEAAIDSREAEEGKQLAGVEQRLSRAESRLSLARSRLADDSGMLTVLESRRSQLLQRIESWRGELWRLGHGSVAVGLVVTALIPLPVVSSWMGSSWTLGLVASQLVLFGCAWALIPEKR